VEDRPEDERAEERRAGRIEAIEEILPLLDDLGRALEHLPADLTGHPWAKGILLIGLNLQSALDRLGVERIGVKGDPFDPNLHEAVAYEPSAEVSPDHVAQVVRPGYRAGERVIRPAQVVVAREHRAIDHRI
jgi:molecular chaperone GrpE